MRAAGCEHVLVLAGQSIPSDLPAGVRVVLRTPNGIADAFNAGLEEATGEWLWFVNGGDRVHETLSMEWLLGHLRATKADVVTGSVQFGDEVEARSMPSLRYQWPLLACWLAHPGTLIRRSVVVKSGGFDARWRVAMDYDLWNRMLPDAAAVDVVSVPVARFALGGVSEHRDNRRQARREDAEIVVRYSGQFAWATLWLTLRVVRRLATGWFEWLITRFSNR